MLRKMAASVKSNVLKNISKEMGSEAKNSGSIFKSKLNPVTGKMEWALEVEDFDFHQEIARSAYADMLHDTERNKKYDLALQKAIQTMHQQGKKANVLDIGTGTALLSMMAVRAKADSVTACEAFSPMAGCALKVINANGFKDKIKIIPKRSTEIITGEGGDMPTRANILVTEVFDTELIGEGAISTFDHAHKHLLEKDCIVVPSLSNMYIQVVQSEFLWRCNRLQPVKVKGVGELRQPTETAQCPGSAAVYDLQLDQLVEGKDFRPITEPFKIFKFDYSGKTPIEYNRSQAAVLRTLRAGHCHAVFMWWDLHMDMDADIILSCAPRWAHPEPDKMQWRDHWMQAVYYPHEAVTVEEEEDIGLHATHDEFSLWFDVSTHRRPAVNQTDPPVCHCGSHVACSRSRILMLNNQKKHDKYIETLKEVITEDSVCVCISNGSYLPFIAAKLGAKKVLTVESNNFPRRCADLYLRENGLEDQVLVLESLDQIENNLHGKKIDILMAEPFFSFAALPWHNLYFWYAHSDIRQLCHDSTVVLPRQAVLKAVAVQFDDLWKIRVPIGDCEGLNLDHFDALMADSSDLVDPMVEAQPLWEYPGIALTQQTTLADFDLASIVPNEQIQSEKELTIECAGHCNGVAIWLDYVLGKDHTVTTGAIEPIIPGEKVTWTPDIRQGVHLFRTPQSVTKDSAVKIITKFNPKNGDIDFSFLVS
ncbi:protein arginine N-methyltransferase 7-like [Lineus longissimus]|uniref:protein arginine N-methyltransferase 7-like n=1 Tax=Lineus longissimus TaxID=88925 RepID=UPI002B4D2298